MIQDEFIEKYKEFEGNSDKLAAHFKLSTRSIRNYKRKYGLTLRNKLDLDKDRLSDLYLNKLMTVAAIAKELAVSTDSIYNYLKKYNLQRDTRYNIALIKQLYEQENYNITQLLEAINIKNRQSLYKIIEEYRIVNPIKNRISDLYVSGLSVEEIAETMKTDVDFVDFNLKHHSIYKLRKVQINKEEIAKERLTLTVEELASKYNCSSRTISSYIQKHSLGPKDRAIYFDYELVYDLYITKNLTLDEVAKELNCARRTVTLFIKKMNIIKVTRVNSLERKVREYLESRDIRFEEHNRKRIKPYEIDFYLPDYNIGIEVCGIYWHSTQINANKYHIFDKFNLARKHGIRLITIFEDEINNTFNIVKNRLDSILGKNDNKKIYARDCVVKVIEPRAGLDFLSEHHVQGPGRNSVYLGLISKRDNSLVAVMAFSKLNPAKGGSQSESNIELNRFANPYSVPGAASKLFKFFTSNYEYARVTSYCDLRWGTGSLYLKLNFKLVSATRPNYWYVVRNERKHRFTYTKQKLLTLLNLEESELTEEVLAESLGLYRIYDCGHLKFEWNRHENT
jgi:transposase